MMWRVLFAVAFLMGAVMGCGRPPRMRLASQIRSSRATHAWWVVRGVPPHGTTVIGLERRLNGTVTEQWLLGRQGARRLVYRSGALTAWGAPLPRHGDPDRVVPRDVLVRYWMRSLPGGSPAPNAARAPASTAHPAHPADPASIHELASYLARRAAAFEVRPPREMSPEAIGRALYEFPTGLSELLALNSQFD